MELTLEMPRTTQPPIDGHKTRMTIDCILRLSCGPGFEVKLSHTWNPPTALSTWRNKGAQGLTVG